MELLPWRSDGSATVARQPPMEDSLDLQEISRKADQSPSRLGDTEDARDILALVSRRQGVQSPGAPSAEYIRHVGYPFL